MTTQKDSRGHVYGRVGNIRITYIPAADRMPEKDWPGSDVIRVQAYKDATSESLHMGAEFPVSTPSDFGDLIGGICQVYGEAKK